MENFSISELRNLYKQEETQYKNSPYYANKIVFSYNAFKQTCDYLTNHIKKIEFTNFFYVNKQIKEFTELSTTFKMFPKELKKWFLEEHHKIYKPVLKTRGQLKDNEINIFKGFKYSNTNKKQPKTDSIDFFIKYLKTVFCSGRDDILDYVMKWIACVLQGKKNTTCLILKSRSQGSGKSSLKEFFEAVLGNEIAGICSTRSLSTDFNMPLMGQLLASVEEMNCNKFQIPDIVKNFNNFLTSSIIPFKEEHKKEFRAANITNLIVTQNSAFLRRLDGRRVVMLDISTDFVNKTGFWNKYYQIIEDPTQQQELFNYFSNIDTSNFNPQVRDFLTNNQVSVKLENLSPVIKFIRDEFLFKEVGINHKTKPELYQMYLERGYSTKYSLFKEELNSYGIPSKNIGGQTKLKYSIVELKAIAKRLEWDIVEDEHYDEEDTEEDDDDVNPFKNELKNQKNTILELQEIIKEQKETLQKLQQQLNTKEISSEVSNQLTKIIHNITEKNVDESPEEEEIELWEFTCNDKTYYHDNDYNVYNEDDEEAENVIGKLINDEIHFKKGYGNVPPLNYNLSVDDIVGLL